MGYTTEFTGAIQLSRPLTLKEAQTLLEYNENPDLIPGEKPDSYMQWVPTESLDQIVWDENEKFYNYTEWMTWLCQLLDTWGIDADGTLQWRGESRDDTGFIQVVKNDVTRSKSPQTEPRKSKPLTMDYLGRLALQQIS